MKRVVISMMMGAAMMVASAPKAEAAVILVFGQTALVNTVTGTQVGGTTTISGTNIGVFITAIENGAPTAASLTFSATNTSVATTTLDGDLTQDFGGTFCITSGANCTGTNYLSGSFTDSATGSPNGSQLTLGASQPPDVVSFTSDIITSLGLGRALSLALTNVIPGLAICGTTLCSFTASIGGNFSGNIPQTQVPEPGTMLLLGTGLLGLAAAARRRLVKS